MDLEERKFAIFSPESMKSFAEQSGFTNVPENVLLLLNEDVNYRLRELVLNSKQFMKHAKRHKLACKDVNRALKWSDSQLIHGHGMNTNELAEICVQDEKAAIF